MVGVALAALVAGCPPATTPHPEQLQTMCSALCARRAECQSGYAQATCVDACRDLRGKRTQWLRADYVRAVTACYAGLSCDDSLKMSAEQSCRDASASSIQPTATATRACEKIVVRDEKCGFEGTQSECLDGFKTFGDDVLNAIAYCTEIGTCWKANRCVNDVVGYTLAKRTKRKKK